jgi:GTP diphosphokinase / guanosine-3',5'-bis(diphosphate) 3'-diphosphatase
MKKTLNSGLARVTGALQYASRMHRDQRRKDIEASPYINHPIALLHILAVEVGITDADVLCAAVLHDVIEDCAETPADRANRETEIERSFGSTVLGIVKEVTDDKDLPKAERKARQVEHAAHLSEQAKFVKLADKTANLRDVALSPPRDWTLQRRREYFDWANQVVQNMGPCHGKLCELFNMAYKAKP